MKTKWERGEKYETDIQSVKHTDNLVVLLWEEKKNHTRKRSRLLDTQIDLASNELKNNQKASIS